MGYTGSGKTDVSIIWIRPNFFVRSLNLYTQPPKYINTIDVELSHVEERSTDATFSWKTFWQNDRDTFTVELADTPAIRDKGSIKKEILKYLKKM
jgi:hypothetical protein